MFLRLWKKECMQVAKSLIYWLYIIVLVMFYVSQMGALSNEMIVPPKPGQESYGEYGTEKVNDEQVIMSAALGKLASGYYYEHFTTYPVGFAKNITLSEAETNEIAEILKTTTGMDKKDIEADIGKFYENMDMEHDWIPYTLEPLEGLSYETFLQQMERVTEILGPGSEFTVDQMTSVRVPMDYEAAKQAYKDLLEKDGYTGAFLRLFCDYMGIIVGILPVFVVATRILRDKRAEMQELVFTRKASSVTVIGSRFLALVSMELLPVLLLSIMPMVDCMLYAKEAGIRLDYLAFLKYDFGWILPMILVVTAVGLFVTEFTESALAILIQGVWWFVSLQTGVTAMSGGNYGWNLIPRHNTTMNYSGFAEGFSQLFYNRLLYVVLSIVFIVAAMWMYEQKRKGHLRRNGKILQHFKRTAKA